ncbi:putative T7SS-secreted protein [Kitasatospora camelliae]|uniref:T7SS-secreted protein n=1 Tax=Kitasatospora camelliae TaxID=3156397 RepID=A0AAU8JS01_9ACTN
MSSKNDYPTLGFDPAPGDPGNVDGLVQKLNKAAGAMESAHRTLTAIGQGGSAWEGDAAKGFSSKIGELPKNMADSVDAMKAASGQLSSWSQTLVSYQNTAKRYEAEAADAKRRKDAAEDHVGRAANHYNSASENPAFSLLGQRFNDDASLASAQQRINAAQAELNAAGNELDIAKRELSSIEDELEAIVKQAKELLEHHQDDADKTAKALRKANQNAPHISVWEKIGNGFKSIGSKIKAWATKHADLLKKIGDIAGGVSAVLGIAALATMWCPPLAAALGAASAGASAVALGAHGLAKLGGANVSWTTIALDGVGAFPFIGTAAKAGKGVAMGAKALATERSVAAAGSHLRGAGKEIAEKFMEGGFAHKYAIEPLLTKTPLKKLPGIANEFSIATREAVGWAAPATSWWSRGTQIGMKAGGLVMNAPNLYHQVTGS